MEPSGKAHWFAAHTDTAQLEETLGCSMSDEEYSKLIDDAADLLFTGRTSDTIFYTM